jgi:hypothetical protein
MNVKFTPRLQMQAAAAAVLLASGLALGHVAAQTPESQAAAQPVAPAQTAMVAAEPEQPKLNERHVNCVAKVVHHEAGNQPREGKLAVAHVLLNRVKKGFGDNVCAVAKQPGQFFRIDRYHPDRKSDGWAEAVDVARDVLAGGSAVMPGMVELAEDIFLKPVRKGLPTYNGALYDMVANPRSATVMGLLEEARIARGRGQKAARQAGSVKTVIGRAKDWFLGNF